MNYKLERYVIALFMILLGSVGCVRLSEPSNGGLNKTIPSSEESNQSVRLGTIMPYQSSGFTISSNGEMYFTNFQKAGRIGKLNLGLNEKPEIFIDLAEWLSPIGDRLPKAEGLRLDHEGRLLIAESGTGKLLRISPDARKLEVLADSYDGYRFATVKDLAIGSKGDLFVSSPLSGTVYRIRPEDGFIGVLNQDLVMVEGLSISPDGKRLVAAEPDASRVVVFDLPLELQAVNSWTLVDFSPSGLEPKGLAFDESGLLYVSLGDREKIRIFDLEQGIEVGILDAEGVAEILMYFDGYLYVSGPNGIRRIDPRPREPVSVQND